MDNIQWINSVVGKPWVDRSTGPDKFDCWGLVVDSFQRIDGVVLPEVAGYESGEPIENIGTTAANGWHEIPDAADGCVFCVYLNNGSMVHVGRVLMINKAGFYAVHAAGKDGVGQVAAEPLRSIKSRYAGRLKYFSGPKA